MIQQRDCNREKMRSRNCRTSEREEACEQRLARDRAHRRQCLISVTAEEQKTHLSRCRARLCLIQKWGARHMLTQWRTQFYTWYAAEPCSWELQCNRDEHLKCQRREKLDYINFELVSSTCARCRQNHQNATILGVMLTHSSIRLCIGHCVLVWFPKYFLY